jgi:hypothetical protein
LYEVRVIARRSKLDPELGDATIADASGEGVLREALGGAKQERGET